MTPDQPYVGKTAYRGDVAANYDRDRVGEPVWQREQAWLEKWAQRIPAGARVLDVPAGTGRFVGILRDRGAHVRAVDISDDMLTELRRRWPAEGENLIVERADAEALPYADGTFDFIVCWRLFHLLPAVTAERVLSELARVCRGELVVEVFGVESSGWALQLVRTVKDRLSKWLRRGCTHASRSTATPWAHITNYPHRELALRAMFERCGLLLVAAETLADYQGRPARIYLLASGGAGR